jgi:glutamine synthetase
MDDNGAHAAADRLADAGLRMLAGTIVDNSGVTRTKVIPVARLRQAIECGVGLSPVFAVMCADDGITESASYGGPAGDMRLVPDMSAAVLVDEATGLGWAPLNQFDQELRPMEICSRQVLARVADSAAAAGTSYRMAFETEFTLFRPDGQGGWTFAHEGPGYGLRALIDTEAFAAELLAAMEEAGLGTELLHPEYAAGQMEVSVAPAPPVAAADRLVLTRLLIARTARRQGLRASFAPVILPGDVGNGCHLHFSAESDGVPLFGGGGGRCGMTARGEHLVAGLVAAVGEMAGLLAPSALSFTRLVPGHWSGAYACWGVENREAAVRFIEGTLSSRPGSANCELKCMDHAANPYLAAAAVIAATQDGLQRALPLPDPVGEAPDSIPEAERQRRGILRLPTDLGAALDSMEKSPMLRSALGEGLLGAFVAVHRYELAAFAGRPEQDVAAALRWRY